MAPILQQPIASAVDSKAKTENQLRAELLRAKLLAQRNKTPSRQQPISRTNTPAKAMPPVETPSKAPLQRATPAKTPVHLQLPANLPQNTLQNNTITHRAGDGEPAGELLDLDALFNQGKALADAKTAAMAAAAVSPAPANSIVPLTNGHENIQASVNTNHTQHNKTVKKKEIPTSKAAPTPLKVQPVARSKEPPRSETNLSDAHYADLPAWLEITGYHDVEFRNARLAAYKERKALEEEAARIAKRLEELRQREHEDGHPIRFGTPKPAASMAPPPLPASMAIEKPVGQVTGTKRPRSPESLLSNKRQEENGFRIRGANESPDSARPPTAVARRRQSPTTPGIDRRISYPDPRRRSDLEDRSRDPSLERRQSYYGRDTVRDVDLHPRLPMSEFPGRERDREREYDHYQPRGARDAPPGFSSARPGRAAHAASASQYRGSAGLDLKRGGQFNSRDLDYA